MEHVQNNLEKDLNELQLEIHISIKKRNGRKCITTVEGLDKVERPNKMELKKFLKKVTTMLKKKFVCGASISGENAIVLSGDHRDKIKEFLLEYKMATEEQIKIHGF